MKWFREALLKNLLYHIAWLALVPCLPLPLTIGITGLAPAPSYGEPPPSSPAQPPPATLPEAPPTELEQQGQDTQGLETAAVQNPGLQPLANDSKEKYDEMLGQWLMQGQVNAAVTANNQNRSAKLKQEDPTPFSSPAPGMALDGTDPGDSAKLDYDPLLGKQGPEGSGEDLPAQAVNGPSPSPITGPGPNPNGDPIASTGPSSRPVPPSSGTSAEISPPGPTLANDTTEMANPLPPDVVNPLLVNGGGSPPAPLPPSNSPAVGPSKANSAEARPERPEPGKPLEVPGQTGLPPSNDAGVPSPNSPPLVLENDITPDRVSPVPPDVINLLVSRPERDPLNPLPLPSPATAPNRPDEAKFAVTPNPGKSEPAPCKSGCCTSECQEGGGDFFLSLLGLSRPSQRVDKARLVLAPSPFPTTSPPLLSSPLLNALREKKPTPTLAEKTYPPRLNSKLISAETRVAAVFTLRASSQNESLHREFHKEALGLSYEAWLGVFIKRSSRAITRWRDGLLAVSDSASRNTDSKKVHPHWSAGISTGPFQALWNAKLSPASRRIGKRLASLRPEWKILGSHSAQPSPGEKDWEEPDTLDILSTLLFALAALIMTQGRRTIPEQSARPRSLTMASLPPSNSNFRKPERYSIQLDDDGDAWLLVRRDPRTGGIQEMAEIHAGTVVLGTWLGKDSSGRFCLGEEGEWKSTTLPERLVLIIDEEIIQHSA